MKNLITVLLFTLLLHSPFSLATEPVHVAYLVVCDDDQTVKLLSDAIESRLIKANFEVSERLPRSKLIVYAQQDINDGINRNGWSFAVAHVTNYSTYLVFAKLLNTLSSETIAAEPALMDMLRHDGFLTYINVAHVDKLDDKNISIITDNFVEEFAKRVQR